MAIKWIKKIYKRLAFTLVLMWRKNKNRFLFFSIKGGIPKIHINEQYEKPTKWILRILILTGIISSIIAFQEWYLNLLLALGLLGLEQLLEKSIFVYFTLYVTAIPEYKSEDWKGMVWVHSEGSLNNYFEVGMFFSTRESAARIFSVIKHWSKEGDEDKSNMVQVSVIINNVDNYHVYIYPNTDIDPTYLAIKEKREKEHPDKEHKIEVLSIMFCKGFNYSNSSFPKFQKSYKIGEPYYLCAYVFENDKPVKLPSLGHIKKNILKIKYEKELTREDGEYEHTKFIIDLDKYKSEQLPPSREYIASRH